MPLQGLHGDDVPHLQPCLHQGPLVHLGVLLQSDLLWPLGMEEEEEVHFLLGHHGLCGMVQDLVLDLPALGPPAWGHPGHPRRDRLPGEAVEDPEDVDPLAHQGPQGLLHGGLSGKKRERQYQLPVILRDCLIQLKLPPTFWSTYYYQAKIKQVDYSNISLNTYLA